MKPSLLSLALAVFLVWLTVQFLGCTNFKTTLPNGTEILYQKAFMDSNAEKVDFYYEDPNTVVWIVVNDPNASVHPGRLIIKEPKSGVELGIVAE